mgnify:CR=1 FL=1
MVIESKRASLAFGALWATVMFAVGLVRLVLTDYGQPFVEVMASIYPGYSGHGTFFEAIIGALYGGLGGSVLGFTLAWFYSCCPGCCAPGLSSK